MTFTPGQMPKELRIKRKAKGYEQFIDLELIRGTDPMIWNGWYREYRIVLRWTGKEFVVEVVKWGVHYVIFRWPLPEPTLDNLQVLVQCACDYVERVGEESIV
ncbi:MAG TPA: hypothetical protein VGM38_10535 [Pseudolysinimonas sp.]|jgi:hypothetical protein